MRRFKSKPNFGVYLIITLGCGLCTLGIELAVQGTSNFQSFAQQQFEGAVRNAVKAEVQQYAREQ